MNDILFIFIKALLIAVLTVLVRYGIPYLQALVAASKYKWMADIARDAVQAAEQTIQASGSGPERKAIVTEYLKKMLTAKNISISDEQLNTLIEAAVYTMNKDKKVKEEDSGSKD